MIPVLRRWQKVLGVRWWDLLQDGCWPSELGRGLQHKDLRLTAMRLFKI